MSARNRRTEKKIRKLRRALRAGRLPARIDLVHYLKLHRHARTTSEAVQLVAAGRVRADSHVLGIHYMGDVSVVDCLAPASVRGSIVVLDA